MLIELSCMLICVEMLEILRENEEVDSGGMLGSSRARDGNN